MAKREGCEISIVERLAGGDSATEGCGEFGATGVPRGIAEEILRLAGNGQISRYNAVGITVETAEKEAPKIQEGRQSRSNVPYEAIRPKAARHHQNREWKKTMYRGLRDVGRKTHPSLKRYVWILIERCSLGRL